MERCECCCGCEKEKEKRKEEKKKRRKEKKRKGEKKKKKRERKKDRAWNSSVGVPRRDETRRVPAYQTRVTLDQQRRPRNGETRIANQSQLTCRRLFFFSLGQTRETQGRFRGVFGGLEIFWSSVGDAVDRGRIDCYYLWGSRRCGTIAVGCSGVEVIVVVVVVVVGRWRDRTGRGRRARLVVHVSSFSCSS